MGRVLGVHKCSAAFCFVKRMGLFFLLSSSLPRSCVITALSNSGRVYQLITGVKLVYRFVIDVMVRSILERLLCLHLARERTNAGTQDALCVMSVTTCW